MHVFMFAVIRSGLLIEATDRYTNGKYNKHIQIHTHKIDDDFKFNIPTRTLNRTLLK